MTSDPVTSAPASTPPEQRVQRGHGAQIWVPILALWFVWGSTYLGIAVAGRTMPPLMANGARFLVAAVLLAAGIAVVKGPGVFRVTRTELAFSALMGTMVLAVGIGTMALAEQYVPSGIAALLVSVNALWIIILRVSAGQRPSRFTLAGVAIGFVGLGLMLIPGGTARVSGTDGDVVLWSAAIIIASFSWAFFSFRSTGYQLPSNALVTTVYELIAGGFCLMGVGAIIGERIDFSEFDRPSWIGWGWLVIASLIGYTAYTYGLNKIPLSLLSTYAYVNPVVAVILGWLIIGEPLTRDVILGLTVVLGGVILVINGERLRR